MFQFFDQKITAQKLPERFGNPTTRWFLPEELYMEEIEKVWLSFLTKTRVPRHLVGSSRNSYRESEVGFSSGVQVAAE